MKRRRYAVLTLLLLGGLSILWADAPGIINYQGKLTDQNGNPLNGGYDIIFALYSAPTGGSALFSETRSGASAVPVDNGVFTVQIGSMTAGGIPKSIFQTNSALYLGVKVGADSEMTPRERLVAAPYALAIATGSVGANEIIDSTITLSKVDLASFDSRYLGGQVTPSTMTITYSVFMATAGGRVGIGTINPSFPLQVNSTDGAAASDIESLYTLTTGDSIGLRNFTKQTTNSNTGTIYGVRAFAYGGNTDDNITIGGLLGVSGEARYRGVATQASAKGLGGIAENSRGGILTNAYSIYASAPDNSGAGSITNAYSLYLEQPIDGTLTNFALYSAGGSNYFGGNVGIGTSVPSYRLHVSSAAGETGTLFAVSTGTTDLFRVLGTSVNLKVPLVFPDGTVQTTAGGGSSQWITNGSSIGYTGGGVGIGTTGTNYSLDVLGTSRFEDRLLLGPDVPADGYGSAFPDSYVGGSSRNVFLSQLKPDVGYAGNLRIHSFLDGTDSYSGLGVGGITNELLNNNSTAISQMIGFNNTVTNQSAASVEDLLIGTLLSVDNGDGNSANASVIGELSTVQNQPGGTVSSLKGNYLTVLNKGTVTDLYGNHIEATQTSGSLINMYGEYINTSLTGGAATNIYGIYISTLPSDSANRFALYSVDGKSYLGGSLGIGTTAPKYQLHVSSAAGATGTIFAVSTGAVNVFSVLGSSVNLKVPLVFPDGSVQTTAGGGASQWTTNGATIGYTAGGVGIGRTNTTAKLEVTNAGGTQPLLLLSTGTAASQEILRVDSRGYLGIGTSSPTGPLEIYSKADGFTPLIVTTYGAVGIGISNPQSVLFDINSEFVVDNNRRIEMNTTNGGTDVLGIRNSGGGDSTIAFRSSPGGDLAEIGLSSSSEYLLHTHPTVPIIFRMDTGSANDVEVMRISSETTNVGIGTPTPSYRLHVSTAAGTTGTIFAVSTGPVNVFSVLGSSVNLKVPLVFPDGSVQTTAGQWTMNGSSLIFTGGNVGIGTTVATYPLTVNGPINGLTLTTITDGFQIGGGGSGSPSEVAAGKSVTASTTWPGLPASNLTDGNTGTEWVPQSGTKTSDQNVVIDLGANYSIDTVKVHTGQNGHYYTRWRIETSKDNSNWTQVYVAVSDQPFFTWNVYNFTAQEARYVRITGIANFYQGEAGFNEIQVWTTGAGFQRSLQITGNNINLNQSLLTTDNVMFNNILASGNVGIGTTAPSYQLQVSTNAGNTGTLFAVSTGSVNVFSVLGSSVNLKVPLVFPDGSVQNTAAVGGSVSLNSTQTWTGSNTFTRAITVSSMSVSGAGLLDTTPVFQVIGGTMTVFANGKVGIGTSAPIEQLDVNGNIRVNYAIRSAQNPVNELSLYDNGVNLKSYLGINLSLDNDNSDVGESLTVNTNGGQLILMTLNDMGSLGLGTTTPSYRLQVSSAAGETGTLFAVTTGTVDLFRVLGTSVNLKVPLVFPDGSVQTTAGGGSGNAVLSATQTWTGSNTFTRAITVSSMNVSGAGLSGTTPVLQVAGATMTVLANGNVGIGTTSPAFALDVIGKARLEDRLFLGPDVVLDGAGSPFPSAYVNSTYKNLIINRLEPGINFDRSLYIQSFLSGSTSYSGEQALGIENDVINNNSADIYQMVGFFNSVSNDNSAVVASNIMGINQSVYNQSSNSPAANMIGENTSIQNQSAGTVSGMMGNSLSLLNKGAVTNLYGNYIDASQTSGSMTNMYGNYIKTKLTGGTITNVYGIYIDTVPTDTASRYALYAVNGKSYIGGNLGVGTTAPSYQLQVSSSAGASGTLFAVSTGPVNVFSVLGSSVNLKVPLVFPDGSVQTTAGGGASQWTTSGATISYSGGGVGIGRSTTTAMLEITNNGGSQPLLLISSGSSASQEVIRVAPNGWIGLHTTPTAPLDVNGLIQASDIWADNYIGSRGNYYSSVHGSLGFNWQYDGTNDKYVNSVAAFEFWQGVEGLDLWTAPAGNGGDLVLQQNIAITFSPDAKIGIGTTAPKYELHVTTNAGYAATLFAVSTGTTDLFRVLGTSVNLKVPLVFPDGSVQTTAGGAAGPHQATHMDGGSDALTGSLTLTTATLTGYNFSVGVSSFVVKNGKVGIGTSDPATTALEVRGTIMASNGYTFAANHATDASNVMTSPVPFAVAFGYGGSGMEGVRLGSTGGLSVGNGYVGTDPGPGAMIISGNVGIGTTTPSVNAKLTVNGAIMAQDGYTFAGNHATDANTAIVSPVPFALALGYGASGTEGLRLGANGGLSIGSGYVGTDPGPGSMIIGGNVGIGTTSPSYLLHVASGAASTWTLFAVSTGTTDLFRVLGTSVNLKVPLVFPDGTVQNTAAGTAGNSKVITLSPEYAGAVLTADGSGTTNGIMATSNAGSAGAWRNYYEWSSSQVTLQDYTVAVRVTLPYDFSSWETTSNALEIDYQTGIAGTSDNSVSFQVNHSTDTPASAVCSAAAAASTSWSTLSCTSSQLVDGGAPEWGAPGNTAVIRIKLKADNTSSALARVGDIRLRYRVKL